jgi:heme-degrading monooxygenase HmoA
MSVIFQLAGKARAQGIPKLPEAMGGLEKALRSAPGFERARLLVSGSTLQTQLLFQWKTFEEGLAFNTLFQRELGKPFQPLLEPRATLITSVLDFSVAGSTSTSAAGEPVVVHFAGSAPAEGIAKARDVLRGTVLPMLQKAPGFQGIEVLANHQEGKIQFLAVYSDFDATFAWFKENARSLLVAFDGAVSMPNVPFFFAVARDINPGVAAHVH